MRLFYAMTIDKFNNGESMASVRGKLNQTIDEANKAITEVNSKTGKSITLSANDLNVYSKPEVDALLNHAGGGVAGVASVNGKSGAITLSAHDVGAYTQQETNDLITGVSGGNGIKSVNTKTPDQNGAVTLNAADVGAIGKTGDQEIVGTLQVGQTEHAWIKLDKDEHNAYLRAGKEIGEHNLLIDSFGNLGLNKFDIKMANGSLATINDNPIFHEGHKPTAADVGALTSGDGDKRYFIRNQNINLNGHVLLDNEGYIAQVSNSKLVLGDQRIPTQIKSSDAPLEHVISGTSYPIYTAHNKPTADDVGTYTKQQIDNKISSGGGGSTSGLLRSTDSIVMVDDIGELNLTDASFAGSTTATAFGIVSTALDTYVSNKGYDASAVRGIRISWKKGHLPNIEKSLLPDDFDKTADRDLFLAITSDRHTFNGQLINIEQKDLWSIAGAKSNASAITKSWWQHLTFGISWEMADAAFVGLQGDQNVDGVKTFEAGIDMKAAAPFRIEVANSNGDGTHDYKELFKSAANGVIQLGSNDMNLELFAKDGVTFTKPIQGDTIVRGEVDAEGLDISLSGKSGLAIDPNEVPSGIIPVNETGIHQPAEALFYHFGNSEWVLPKARFTGDITASRNISSIEGRGIYRDDGAAMYFGSRARDLILVTTSHAAPHIDYGVTDGSERYQIHDARYWGSMPTSAGKWVFETISNPDQVDRNVNPYVGRWVANTAPDTAAKIKIGGGANEGGISIDPTAHGSSIAPLDLNTGTPLEGKQIYFDYGALGGGQWKIGNGSSGAPIISEIPDVPTADGDYVLRIQGGTRTWVKTT
ncbi:TPA: hypothetical protein ACRZZI_004964 [Vibrio harveyi]